MRAFLTAVAIVWSVPFAVGQNQPQAQPAAPQPPGPKAGFRDMKWGDPPKAGWKLKKRDAFQVYVDSHLMDQDKILGIDYNKLTYHFAGGKFCGIEIEYAPLFADQLYSALQSAWGPPAVGNEQQATWSAQHEDGVTDATFVRRYAPATTQRILFGGDPMPTVRIFHRGCGAPAGADSGL